MDKMKIGEGGSNETGCSEREGGDGDEHDNHWSGDAQVHGGLRFCFR